jgi:hypothetical protein
VIENGSCAIVILSSDKYSDLWKAATDNCIRMFGELNLPIYLIVNELDFDSNKIKVVNTGVDLGWAEMVKKALPSIKEDYVLILLEDMPIIQFNDKEELANAFQILRENDLGALHLRPVPKPKSKIDKANWYLYEGSEPYLCNVFSLWNKNTFEKVLAFGENAWEFEINGSPRLGRIARVGCLSNPIFEYVHLVEKGLWVPKISRMNEEHSLNLDISKRPKQKRFSISRNLKKTWFFFMLDFVPYKLRVKTSRFVKLFFVTY